MAKHSLPAACSLLYPRWTKGHWVSDPTEIAASFLPMCLLFLTLQLHPFSVVTQVFVTAFCLSFSHSDTRPHLIHLNVRLHFTQHVKPKPASFLISSVNGITKYANHCPLVSIQSSKTAEICLQKYWACSFSSISTPRAAPQLLDYCRSLSLASLQVWLTLSKYLPCGKSLLKNWNGLSMTSY